ncbi:MAG TPA: SMP-30/gluconolactonase/LRE family protein [Steroidobacteraceae bacterium]|jgi:gluconolactonase|nr:SMP-30/gluconolactonase/LRE family protein [Steroidobacteraceae bacterium]
MRASLLAVTLSVFGVTAALAQTATVKKTEGPGLKAQEDARYAGEISSCQRSHPPDPNAPRRARPRATGPTYQPPASIEAIAGVVRAGARWHQVWTETGNNADGIVGLPDGSVLVAQQDNSAVVSIDPKGHADTVYRDTNTGGAVSINKKGEVFIVERGYQQSIQELAPEHKVLADKYQGDSLDCVSSLNDLTAASNGGVYFTFGKLYYAAPDGTVTQEGTTAFTNGIILSADEKTLYVTNGGDLDAFDVQPDGSLANQRVLAKLTSGGDGSTIDSEGRIYVTSNTVIDVIAPTGELLGVIPVPKGDAAISVAFGGPGKHTLYCVALNKKFHHGSLGLPSDTVQGGQGGELIAIRLQSQGYSGRDK